MSFLPYLHRVADGHHLSSVEARLAMLSILSGEVSATLIAAFLAALRTKGETAAELFGFATAMRERATPVDAGLDGRPLLDTCGTGGDGGCTFNISTVAAFVVAGAGVAVAKHGNRSLSSQCGSADILEALGVNIALDAAAVARSIREVGIGFLFAPMLHPAMKWAQPARVELKMRTAFNLLGPLANPAGASAQLIGAPSEHAAELMAQALSGFAPKRAFVVHGSGGLDEVTTLGPTAVFEVRGSEVSRHIWSPADFGIPEGSAAGIRGGDRETNCTIARQILDEGVTGPSRDIVVVNAAAALLAAERVTTLREGVALAQHSLDSGAAGRSLAALITFTNAPR